MMLFVLATIIFTVLAEDFWSNFEEIPSAPSESFGAIPKCGEGDQKDKYICVPYFNCDPLTRTVVENPSVDGSSHISPRLSYMEPSCSHYLHVCCQMPNATVNPIQPVTTLNIEFASKCGVSGSNESSWTVEVFDSSKMPLALCGGSLITPVAALTAAHCVKNLRSEQIHVKVGNQMQKVASIIIHKHYLQSTLYNDIALLILNSSVSKDPNINTICLPTSTDDVNLQNCSVTRRINSMDVTLVPNKNCQNFLKEELGEEFILDRSFLCARSDSDKGICMGDGGYPLICRNLNRYYQMGIISWGLGCDKVEIPDVFTDITRFKDWIDNKLQELGYNSDPYTP